MIEPEMLLTYDNIIKNGNANDTLAKGGKV